MRVLGQKTTGGVPNAPPSSLFRVNLAGLGVLGLNLKKLNPNKHLVFLENLTFLDYIHFLAYISFPKTTIILRILSFKNEINPLSKQV